MVGDEEPDFVMGKARGGAGGACGGATPGAGVAERTAPAVVMAGASFGKAGRTIRAARS